MSTLAQTNARCGANVELCFEPNPRGARKSLAALQGGPMVKRIAPSRIIWFCLLAACGALCQSESPSADFVYRDGSNSPELQLPVSRTWKSLPDTPSVTPAKEFRRFFGEAHSPSAPMRVQSEKQYWITSKPHRSPALPLIIKRCQLKKGLVAFWAGIYIRLYSSGIRVIILRPAQLNGPGHICRFAHSYHAGRLRKEQAEHLVFPRSALRLLFWLPNT